MFAFGLKNTRRDGGGSVFSPQPELLLSPRLLSSLPQLSAPLPPHANFNVSGSDVADRRPEEKPKPTTVSTLTYSFSQLLASLEDVSRFESDVHLKENPGLAERQRNSGLNLPCAQKNQSRCQDPDLPCASDVQLQPHSPNPSRVQVDQLHCPDPPCAPENQHDDDDEYLILDLRPEPEVEYVVLECECHSTVHYWRPRGPPGSRPVRCYGPCGRILAKPGSVPGTLRLQRAQLLYYYQYRRTKKRSK